MANKEKFEIVVFKILKQFSDGLMQKDLVDELTQVVPFKQTKIIQELKKLTYPFVDKSDSTNVFPGLLIEDVAINGRLAKIYKLNKTWVEYNEEKFKDFINKHIGNSFEFMLMSC